MLQKNEKVDKTKRLWKVYLFQCIAIYYWFVVLKDTDAFYAVYLVVGAFGCAACFSDYKNNRRFTSLRDVALQLVLAVLFSLIVLAANYNIFHKMKCPQNAGPLFILLYKGLAFLLVFMGGLFLAFHLLIWISDNLVYYVWSDGKYRYRIKDSCLVFSISLLLICATYTLIWALCKYPGNLSSDSFSQIRQSLTGDYSNHHPFYHTIIINACIQFGMKVFGDINAGVAVYSILQILFMGSIFSYATMTLYQMKLSTGLIVLNLLWYTCFPIHIMYSFTMWKDVMFGGWVFLLITAMYRIMQDIGNKEVNYILMISGSTGMCLFRSNGWFAFLLTVISLALLNRKESKINKIVYAFVIVLIVTYILKNPFLDVMQIRQPDIIESLSIPIQQVARVIKDCDDLTVDERELLENIVEVDAVSDVYLSYISDPVKNLMRKTNDGSYLMENKVSYIGLYLEIGIRHPEEYLEAWIDQTKGYWNGGYDYWWWGNQVDANDYGVERKVALATFNKWLDEYIWLYANVPALQIFLSIGLYVWIICLLCYINIVRRNKNCLLLTIPVLSVIATLLIATPVYSECRYAYIVFCSTPFLIFVTFYGIGNREEHV